MALLNYELNNCCKYSWQNLYILFLLFVTYFLSVHCTEEMAFYDWDINFYTIFLESARIMLDWLLTTAIYWSALVVAVTCTEKFWKRSRRRNFHRIQKSTACTGIRFECISIHITRVRPEIVSFFNAISSEDKRMSHKMLTKVARWSHFPLNLYDRHFFDRVF